MIQLMEKKANKKIIEPPKIEPPPEIKPEKISLNVILFSISLEYIDDKTNKLLPNEDLFKPKLLLHPVLRVFSVKAKRYIETIHLENNIFNNYNNDILYRDRLLRVIKGYIV